MTSEIIYTIGHSNHPIERFVGLLARRGIATLADVRSHPGSRFCPQFNRGRLEGALDAAGIRYAFLGAELGARSTDPDCYEGDRVSYRRLAASAPFRRGIDQVLQARVAGPIALMCAERDPLDCHRTILIARELDELGVPVAHLLFDGALETQGAAMLRLAGKLGIAAEDLFADPKSLAARACDVQGSRIAYVRPAARADGKRTARRPRPSR